MHAAFTSELLSSSLSLTSSWHASIRTVFTDLALHAHAAIAAAQINTCISVHSTWDTDMQVHASAAAQIAIVIVAMEEMA